MVHVRRPDCRDRPGRVVAAGPGRGRWWRGGRGAPTRRRDRVGHHRRSAGVRGGGPDRDRRRDRSVDGPPLGLVGSFHRRSSRRPRRGDRPVLGRSDRAPAAPRWMADVGSRMLGMAVGTALRHPPEHGTTRPARRTRRRGRRSRGSRPARRPSPTRVDQWRMGCVHLPPRNVGGTVAVDGRPAASTAGRPPVPGPLVDDGEDRIGSRVPVRGTRGPRPSDRRGGGDPDHRRGGRSPAGRRPGRRGAAEGTRRPGAAASRSGSTGRLAQPR